MDMILIPEEKQCHSLLSELMRKNGVEVLSLVEKIDYYCAESIIE